MSDLQAEIFPERVELQRLDHGLLDDAAFTTMGTMASFSERGLSLKVADPSAIAAFPCGAKVRGSYGDHSGFCQFDSEVIEATAADGVDHRGIIRLVPPRHITTTQRRRHVRAEVDLTIPCALLDAKNNSFLSAPGEVANLGGGGLMMVIAAHRSLKVGSKLALALSLPGSDTILALGQAVHVVVGSDGPATVRLAFTSIDAGDRERVERFAYRKLGGTAPAKLWASGKITSTQPRPP